MSEAATPGRPWAGLRAGGLGLLATAGVVALAVLAGRAGRPPGREADPPDDEAAGPPPAVAALDRPPGAAGVSPDAPVIGVTAGGKHRAYLVSRLTEVRAHVVNDFVGGGPLSVAYCDRTDCARAFTAPGRAAPLDLAVGGYTRADGMLVRVGRHRYTQQAGRAVDPDAPAFPYRPVAVERTTWGAWAAAHPDTDLYSGVTGD